MKTQSDTTIGSVRAELLARTDLVGPQLRAALTAMYDEWLAGLLSNQQSGIALMAVGGLGRKEPAPYGDLDLVMLHDGKLDMINQIADGLWYPIWDARIGLDHSVRTTTQAVQVAEDDLKAALGMLDARHIAGDATLTAAVREQVVLRWQRTAPARLAGLQDLARARWATRGDASFLLEPDLKDSRGGLRDWVGLRALASAQLLDLTPAMIEASTALLDVRGELHRVAGRASDSFRAQDRDGIAEALGLPDADAALRTVNLAARTIAFSTDAAWRRVAGAFAPASRSWLRKRRPGETPVPVRTPLAPDVIAHGGEVVLARDAAPAKDPVLMLRVARAAAQHDLPISEHTLRRLATESAELPVPWPPAARAEFVTILGTGSRAVAALEALDQHGLMSRLIPDWEWVRCRAQHNPVHKYTVDRHLLEAAVQASRFAGEVARPDLLLIAAFLHDIGKGHPGDHSVVGALLAGENATRMGYPEREATLLSQLALHHLLLPDTATRRDLDDPSTVATVITAIGDSPEFLELLHYLSIADAAATGPAAWSDWKAALIARLVNSTHAVMHGEPMPEPEPVDPALLALAQRGESRVVIDGMQVSVLAPDSVGLLSRAAGVLAMNSLDVQSAAIRTIAGMAINTFVVSPRFGELPDPQVLQTELNRVVSGSLELGPRLRAKAEKYEQHPSSGRTRLLWLNNEATDATILEVRAPDRLGLLYWVSIALEATGVEVRSARISSLGGFVVDAFYLSDSDGKPVSDRRQQEISASVLAELAA